MKKFLRILAAILVAVGIVRTHTINAGDIQDIQSLSENIESYEVPPPKTYRDILTEAGLYYSASGETLSNLRFIRWVGYGFSTNFGLGLMYPITSFLCIRGEISYMTTEFADSVVGFRGFKYAILDTATTMTVPILLNIMIRPGNFMFDLYGGGSFFGNKEISAFMYGMSVGHKVGKIGYLFTDARLGFGLGERFQSFGIGYEFRIPRNRHP
ncbi:MAG: hypothetical protein FWE23_11375 [Chitinivibrionia bacterium]|nr:hypothetical protein [Chitinivibrionia bacterium]